MIELLVTCQGLHIDNAMHAIAVTDARHRIEVVQGRAHPPTFVTSKVRWGLSDHGVYPPEGVDDWLLAVYGRNAESLLRKRRVNVVRKGHRPIVISTPRGRVSLQIRNIELTRLEHHVWAGPADYSIDGIVDFQDVTHFLADWHAGRADYDCDGATTGYDITRFMEVWNDGGLVPCAADVDGNGTLDVFDLLLFLNWWTAADPRADLPGASDGHIDVRDLLIFLSSWFEGCD